MNEILTHTLGPTTYRRDDPLKERIIAHFRLNLIRMVQIARESGAEVLFVQPAINLKDMSLSRASTKRGSARRGSVGGRNATGAAGNFRRKAASERRWPLIARRFKSTIVTPTSITGSDRFSLK